MKIIFLILLISNMANAAIEIAASYNYTRQDYKNIDQTQPEDVSATRSYNASLAWYVFSTTAIEVFYTSNEDITIDNAISLEDTTNSKIINSIKTTLVTDSLGVGIRQALAPRGAFILPTLSIGHSNQVQQTKYKYSYTDTSSGEFESGEVESEVSYITFAVRLKFSEYFGLRGSVTGTYSELDFTDKAQQITYSAGFSWIF